MHSNELNKVFCAILAVLTFTVGLQIFASELYRPQRPAQPGYTVAVAGAPAAEAPAAAAPEQVNMAEVMANASAERGQTAFRQCGSCHTVEKGGATRQGPNLYGILAGPMAHIQGFNYSNGLRTAAQAGRQWSYEELYRFLEAPRRHIPGTTMTFAGIRRSSERADVIAYLRQQSDSPPALPQ
jgi:cytochrome c